MSTRSIPCRPALVAVAVVTAALAALLGAPSPGHAAVEWKKLALADALELAKQQHSVVILDVYADWCGPCHTYDEKVFNRDDVATALGNAVTVRIDGEKGEGPDLVKRYHVVGYPTILFLAPDGQEIDRIFGYLEADPFKATAADYLAGKKTIGALEKELAGRPNDHALRFDVVRRMVIRGELDKALALAGPIFDKDPDNKLGFVPALHDTFGNYGYLRGAKNYDKAIAEFDAILTRFPDSDEAKQARYPLARAWFGKGDNDKALSVLQAHIDVDPRDVGRYNAVAWFCFQNDLALEQAVTLAAKGLAIDPKAAYLLDTLAELHFKLGQHKQAIAAIKKAVAADPKDPYYKKQLARFKAGKKQAP